MDIQRAFQIIKIFYGSHSKAASTLGFSRDHYRALRNGRVRIPARTVEYTAQGFPPDYIIDELPGGKRLTKTAQIRMCGNSVPPELVEALVRANGPDTWIQRERPAYPLLKACFAGLQSYPQTVEMTCTT